MQQTGKILEKHMKQEIFCRCVAPLRGFGHCAIINLTRKHGLPIQGDRKMGKRIVRIIVILLFAMAVFSAAIWCAARFVYLSPACYPDNKNLTERENYFIRKVVLEAIEYRLSVFADGNADFEAIEEQDKRKHVFVLINSNFMNSVTKDNNGYVVNVQTYFMEPESSDCQYEIHLSTGFSITSFELDP